MTDEHTLTTHCANGKTGYGVEGIYEPDFICKRTAQRLCELADKGISIAHGAPWLDILDHLTKEGLDISCHPIYWEQEGDGKSPFAPPKQEPESVFDEIRKELSRARSIHPVYPTDPLHGIAIITEELGELTQAALQTRYEPKKATVEMIRAEAVQTAAMAVRFLENFGRMDFPSPEEKTHDTETPA